MAEPPDSRSRLPTVRWRPLLLLSCVCIVTTTIYLLVIDVFTWQDIFSSRRSIVSTAKSQLDVGGPARIDGSWYPPNSTAVNDLQSVINGTGVFGYVFQNTTSELGREDGEINWCDMPRVRAKEYVIPQGFENGELELRYVEVIHRHHKRTPYQSNIFPLEPHPFPCTSKLEFSATSDSVVSTHITWNITPSPLSPFDPSTRAFPNTSCLFPQITAGGLQDSYQHGLDLASVYGHTGLLHFLPPTFDPHTISFRVTNNHITSQVASALIPALFPDLALSSSATIPVSIPVTVQPATTDSLEPAYDCPRAKRLYKSYGIGSHANNWTAHLDHSTALIAELDAISGINARESDWHISFDHYFDNLSAKLCHAVPLPCRSSLSSPSNSHSDPDNQCITPSLASAVFRRGMYEYSYIYRDAPESLPAATASYGLFLAELAANLRRAATATATATDADAGTSTATEDSFVKYRHHIAHDGSISRLLSILQLEVMGWPGMGAEIVFEVWRRRQTEQEKRKRRDDPRSEHRHTSESESENTSRGQVGGTADWYVRVLWMGRVLRSSHPSLGVMDMVPLDRVLGYFGELVGRDGSRVKELCGL